MDARPRLSRFGSALKKRAARIEKWAVLQSDRGLQWLYARCEPVNWKTIRAKVSTTLRLSTNTSGLFASAAIFVVLAIFIPVAWRWYSYELFNNNTASYPHANLVNPVVAAVGAALLIGAAIWQARTATKQAEIAAQRHFAQTEADRQRRITESFSKAIEQLGNDKLEVRLGGIYALERISKESPDDYWTVMENLTAFVWERSHRNEIERTSEGFEQRVSRRAYFSLAGGWPAKRAG